MPQPYDMMAAQQAQMSGLYGSPGIAPVPGASHYPPSFSYAYGPNSSIVGPGAVGGAMTGAVGAVPGTVAGIGAAAGIASMFTPSAAIGALSYLDPMTAGFNVGFGRFAAARAAGVAMPGALGAGALGAAAPLAIGTAALGSAMYTGQQFMLGGQEQQGLNAQLSGMQFANMGSPTFRGFGFRQLQEVGKMMREFESNDPFTSMRDLNQMMDQFNQMGMSQGVRNAKEFSKKFTTFVDTVRDIAMELGTTLEDAGRTFGQMRQIGFYNANDVMGNTRSMQIAQSLGMNQDVFLGMQGQSSGITRGANMSGRAGALTSARFSRGLLIGAGSRGSGGLGLFSGEDLMDITGAATSGEAAAQMGSQFTGALTNFLTSTAAGRAMLGAVGEQENGRFTGAISGERLASVAGTDLQALNREAGFRLRTGSQKSSFVTQEAEIASALLEDPRGAEAVFSKLRQQANEWARDGQHNQEDAMRLFAEQVLGLNEPLAKMFTELVEHQNEVWAVEMQQARQEAMANKMRLEMSRNRTVAGLKQRISGGISDVFAPVKQAGADVSTWAEDLGMRTQDAVFGVSRYNISQDSRTSYNRRFAAGTVAPGSLSPVELPGFNELPDDTALQAISRRKGTRFALETRRRMMMPGFAFREEDFALSPGEREIVENSLTGFGMGSREAQVGQTQRLAARYRIAKMSGDEKAMERAREEFRQHARSNVLRTNNYTKEDEERLMAYIAHTVGDDDLAKDIMASGSTPSNLYERAEEIKGKTESVARDVGLSPAQARALAEGGPGANVLAWMGRDESRQSGDFFETFIGQNLDAGASWEVMAGRLSEQTGQQFTGADVKAAYEMISNVKAREGSAGTQTFNRQTGESYTVGGVKARSRDAGVALLTSQANAAMDASITLDQREAVRSALTAGGEGVRSLGSWKRLEEAFGGDDVTAQRMALRSMASELQAGGADGVMGAQNLALVGERMRRASKSTENLMEVYGFSDRTSLTEYAHKELGLGTGTELSPEDQQKLIEALGAGELQGQLASTAGGGVWLRGQSVEEQMILHMTTLATEVGKMAEKNTEYVTAVEESSMWSRMFGN
jgi:hypothetical protein